MKRIGVLSDTHGHLPPQVFDFFKDVDEIWHAGDIGYGVLEPLRDFKPVQAVWGNTDDYTMHHILEERLFFTCGGLRVLLTHIGGYPGHYSPGIRKALEILNPDIFVCGHSHILRVIYDKEYSCLHINPGAAGRTGFHQVSTLVRFTIDGTPKDLEFMKYEKFASPEPTPRQ